MKFIEGIIEGADYAHAVAMVVSVVPFVLAFRLKTLRWRGVIMRFGGQKR